jgi:hypothetical protein
MAIVGAARQSSTNRWRHIKSGKDEWNGENKFRGNCNTTPLADLNAKSARFFSALVSAATQEVFAPGFPSDWQAEGRATATAFLRIGALRWRSSRADGLGKMSLDDVVR